MKQKKIKDKKKLFDLNTKEDNIKVQDQYLSDLKLLLEEKVTIEKKIEDLNLIINEKEAELKKINKEKRLNNATREELEKKEKTISFADKKKEVEKKRQELDKKIIDIVNIESRIEEIILEKKNQLKEANTNYSFLTEKILETEENIRLIKEEIQNVKSEELENKENNREVIPIKEKETKSMAEEANNEQKEKRDQPEHSGKEKVVTGEGGQKNQSVEADKVELEREKNGAPVEIIDKRKEEEMLNFFKLFYQKIWLMIVTLNEQEKSLFKKIIISGGADFIPELTEYIREENKERSLDVKVEIANPFINIDQTKSSIKTKKISQFSNAIGAALKGFK